MALETVSTDRKRVVAELVHGRNLATQLQVLLHQPFSDDGSASAEDLVVKILRSFTETLALMKFYDKSGGDSNESSGKCKSGENNRRGCYKRRKNSQTWTVVSSTIEDGHAWRKYGQKEILNAKFPRSYYRCTRKFEQDCRATKQVQRIDGEPSKYLTTYIGHHTCRDLFKAPQFIGASCFIGSELKIPKQQVKEETVVSDLTDNLSSMDDSVNLWSGLEALDPLPAASVPRDWSDHGDHEDVDSAAYSRNASTSFPHNLDLDFALNCVDFGDEFHFDETQFL